MRTSEVLNKAADLIEQHGWATGSGAWHFGDHKQRYCLEGGIMAALGIEFGGNHRVDGVEVGALEYLRTCPAYAAVEEYLLEAGELAIMPDGTPQELWSWNDRRGDTAERVIGVLRATALLEAVKENNNTEVTA